MRRVIMVSGNLQNGKDTFCDRLQAELTGVHGLKVLRVAFADRLRDFLAKDFKKVFVHYNNVIQGAVNYLKVHNSHALTDLAQPIEQLMSLVTTQAEIFGKKNAVSRLMHQCLGGCIRDNVDNYFWCNEVLGGVLGKDFDVLLLSDLRFSEDYYNLLDCMEEYYDPDEKVIAICVRVNRTGWKNDPVFMDDSSEKSMVDFDEYNFIIDAESVSQIIESAKEVATLIANTTHP